MTVTEKSFRLLPLIGFIEFFERFGFYTLQGILVLYLLKVHHYSSEEAYHIFGAFSALVYGFVGVGGWCGDKIFGPRKTLLIGLVIMFLGYFGMSVFGKKALFPALAAICIGNALFKANPGALLGHMYRDDSIRLHYAFTIFYMTVNIGALFALILGPFLSSTFGYAYAFAASAIGLVLAIIMVLLKQDILDEAVKEKVFMRFKADNVFWFSAGILVLWGLVSYLLSAYDWVIFGLKIVIVVVLVLYLKMCLKEKQLVRHRMYAVLILMFEAVVFFTLYQQMPTSINMYAIMHVHPQIFGIPFDAQSFQALNPFWIIIWSPFLAKFYQKNALSEHPWSIFRKFTYGMFCSAISYGVLYGSQFYADEQFYISGLWLVLSYVFQSLAELLVSALGLAMVAELVPSYRMGGVMGMWFLTSAVSGFTGAKVASLTSLPQQGFSGTLESLHAFANVFGGIALVILLIAGLMFWSIRFLENWVAKKNI
jgi:proton-dependent oligopeptide transporter, POT family